MPANKPRRSGFDTGHQTITLEEYKAALAAKDIAKLRSTGTDISAHTSAPEKGAHETQVSK